MFKRIALLYLYLFNISNPLISDDDLQINRQDPVDNVRSTTNDQLQLDPKDPVDNMISITNVQHKINQIKKDLATQLNLSADQRNLTNIREKMQKLYQELFAEASLEPDHQLSLNRQLFLKLNSQFASTEPEIVTTLADLSYIWYIYDKIQPDSISLTTEASIDPTVSLEIGNATHHPTAHDWSLLTAQAGFSHQGEFAPQVATKFLELTKPRSSFRTLNTMLHYTGYAMTTAADTAWFFFPEQTYGLPQEWINAQYYNDPDRVYSDMAATYHRWIDPSVQKVLDTASWISSRLKRSTSAPKTPTPDEEMQ